MEYILEIHLQEEGDVVELRRADQPFPVVFPGDILYIEFDNDVYNTDHGTWFEVIGRQVYLFSPASKVQTMRLYVKVDFKQGTPS